MTKIRLAFPLQSDSIVDGEGIRTVVWTQGCLHHCPGCHNPQTHDLNGGIEYDIEEIKKEISELEWQDGITLSGGDPFFQAKASAEIAQYAKSVGMNVWAYTGYTYEQLLSISQKNQDIRELLYSIDVLVDGRFEQDKKSLNIRYRGSTNQRIINVPESLKENQIIIEKEFQNT